jgi:hypothetical protein
MEPWPLVARSHAGADRNVANARQELNDGDLHASLAKAVKAGTARALSPRRRSTERARAISLLAKGRGIARPLEIGFSGGGSTGSCDRRASDAADALGTETFCSILRNGLAHGGVLYLDKHGRTTEGAPVTRFCFVSTKQKKQAIVGLHFLQVTIQDYRAFLGKWVGWLQGAALKPMQKKT